MKPHTTPTKKPLTGQFSLIGRLAAERVRLETLLKEFDRTKIQKRIDALRHAELVVQDFAPRAANPKTFTRMLNGAAARAEQNGHAPARKSRSPHKGQSRDNIRAVADKNRAIVVDALGAQPMMPAAIEAATGISRSVLHNYLTQLKTKKQIKPVKGKGWVRV